MAGHDSAPARRMQEIFAASGLDKAFESPWGRSYRDKGSPCPPAGCSPIQVHGKVPRDQLELVLKRSGHNRIFATPKSWSNEALPGFQIVWVGPDREQALHPDGRPFCWGYHQKVLGLFAFICFPPFGTPFEGFEWVKL